MSTSIKSWNSIFLGPVALTQSHYMCNQVSKEKKQNIVVKCPILWNSLAFSMIQWMLAILSLAPLPFLKPAWTSGSSHFMYCWSLGWRILSITLLVCEMSAIIQQFENSYALSFFWIEMKTDLFQSCDHCCIFQICWHIECSTFTALSVRIWNSSAQIPSPPLVLFIVMLSKVHLTSHSRISGSRWVITPSWLSGSWRSFEYSSSVYSCLFIGSSKKHKSSRKKDLFMLYWLCQSLWW